MYALLFFLSAAFANGNPETINLINTEAQRQSTHAAAQHRFESLSKSVVEVRNPYGYGTGTAVAYRGDKYVITAAHVVRGIDVVTIVHNGVEHVGNVIYQDMETDLAVVSISEDADIDTYKLKKRRSDVPMGEELYYCGYPNRTSLACFKGTVSLSETDLLNIHSYAWMGASGSLVVDSRGRAIGIVSAVEVGQFLRIPTIIEDIVWIRPLDTDLYEFLESLR